MEAQSVLVFDIGGSHLSAGIYANQKTHLLATTRLPLDTLTSTEDFLGLVERAIQKLTGSALCQGAAFAIAGPFDYKNGISAMTHKLSSLYGFGLKHAVAARFGWSEKSVVFLNDAEAALLGELESGIGAGSARVLGITLGTGIGSALAVEGKLLEVGDGKPPWTELWDAPYNGATVEDFLSTRSLESGYRSLGGDSIDVREIAHRADSDPRARAVFEQFGTHLGVVLGTIITPFAPEVVCLGGGIARAAELFLPAARRVLDLNGCQTNEMTANEAKAQALPNAMSSVRLHQSYLFDQAPLIGAGVRWFGRCER